MRRKFSTKDDLCEPECAHHHQRSIKQHSINIPVQNRYNIVRNKNTLHFLHFCFLSSVRKGSFDLADFWRKNITFIISEFCLEKIITIYHSIQYFSPSWIIQANVQNWQYMFRAPMIIMFSTVLGIGKYVIWLYCWLNRIIHRYNVLTSTRVNAMRRWEPRDAARGTSGSCHATIRCCGFTTPTYIYIYIYYLHMICPNLR